MLLSKRETFRADEVQMAILAKALGHPARIAILKFLSECGSSICGQIVDALPLSQSTVSQHLQELKNAELIEWEEEGAAVNYRVNTRTCHKALNQFHYMFNRIQL